MWWFSEVASHLDSNIGDLTNQLQALHVENNDLKQALDKRSSEVRVAAISADLCVLNTQSLECRESRVQSLCLLLFFCSDGGSPLEAAFGSGEAGRRRVQSQASVERREGGE